MDHNRFYRVFNQKQMSAQKCWYKNAQAQCHIKILSALETLKLPKLLFFSFLIATFLESTQNFSIFVKFFWFQSVLKCYRVVFVHIFKIVNIENFEKFVFQ